ncbi:hypothetical protein ACP4OV_009785 [Aristida adscensionis]
MDPGAAEPPCVIQALPANPRPGTPPPLVQALPAQHPSPAKEHPPAAAAAAAASRPARRREPLLLPPPPPPPGPAPPSPRRTRSGGAPEWTAAETLALVAEVAAVDDGWSRSVSAFQKWAIVAENLAAALGPARRSGKGRGRGRAAAECRRRWEALAAEYGAVRRWEVRTGGRYREMGCAARRKAGLPAEFDAEVYEAMDALIRVEEALLAGAAGGGGGGGGVEEEVEGLVGGGAGVEAGGDDAGDGEAAEEEGEAQEGEAEDGEEEEQEEGEAEDREEEEQGEGEAEDGEEEEQGDGEDEEREEEMQVDGQNGNSAEELGCEVGTNSEPPKSQNVAWELANQLHENAQHIHTIIQEEAGEDGGQSHAISMTPDAMETTRQKADELIKSLGVLVSDLNQFTELIRENGFENVIGMN